MKEQVQNILISQLHPFQNHPFQLKDDEAMTALCDSIREYSVLSPMLARPTTDGYEVVSGHRRRAAAMKLGLKELPVLVRDMTDDEAVILMVDSNIQRENLLPSEKAFAYKMKRLVKCQSRGFVYSSGGTFHPIMITKEGEPMKTNSVLKLTYTQSGDYMIPNIALADFDEEISRYCRMRRDYLKENNPILYNDLVLSGNLFPHLAEINRTSLNRLRIMLPQLKAQYGITEELKAADQMRWVQEMTAIRQTIEELIQTELIYA